jgi:hypothetical protein
MNQTLFSSQNLNLLSKRKIQNISKTNMKKSKKSNLLVDPNKKQCKNVKFFQYIYIWLLKNIFFNFKTKLTIKDHFARINITLPTKTRPIFNQEILLKI